MANYRVSSGGSRRGTSAPRVSLGRGTRSGRDGVSGQRGMVPVSKVSGTMGYRTTQLSQSLAGGTKF